MQHKILKLISHNPHYKEMTRKQKPAMAQGLTSTKTVKFLHINEIKEQHDSLIEHKENKRMTITQLGMATQMQL